MLHNPTFSNQVLVSDTFNSNTWDIDNWKNETLQHETCKLNLPCPPEPIGNPDISLWGDVAHSGMGLHLAWLLDRRKQPQKWGKEWKGKHFYINTCFNILKHHSSEECICPYISLRLLVCWLTWLVTEQHTYEWSKKNICPPLCWLPLVTPLIFPHILYSLAITITFTYFWTLWLPLLHLFSPFTPLLHIVQPFGYHSYIPFPLLHPFYIFLNPLATTLTSLFSYITPLWHVVWHIWKVFSHAPRIQVFVGLTLNRIISIRKSSYWITISSQVPLFHICCLESPVGKKLECFAQVQRAGTIWSSLDNSHIFLSQTSHREIWLQRCSFNLQACRKTKQARSTCVVANLLGMQGTENLAWANDLLKGDQDTANMISSMFHQKTSMKKQKIQRP